jgi:predicted phosphodiesterase
MRLAILSDIHGNSIALDAVLADIELQGGVDAYWILGDLVAVGHDPTGVLEKLLRLPNAHFVGGNTDRYVTTGDTGTLTLTKVQADPLMLSGFAEASKSFAWTQGAITAIGQLDWLASLPLEQRIALPDGTRVLGVHASPLNDEKGFNPSQSDDNRRALLAGSDADLIFCGHTHWPLDVQVGGTRILNLGSVSNPHAPDLRAKYALLQAEDSGHHIERRFVNYDHQAVIAALHRVRHPATAYITQFMLGQHPFTEPK